MALPPTIPTSFVPRPSAVAARGRTDLSGAFAFFGYGALGFVVLLAIGVFVYSSVLAADQSSKDTQLAQAIAGIDPSTVANFAHLRARLSSGEELLNNHLAISTFLGVLGSLMPSSVAFTDMHLLVGETGQVTVEANGLAKSFNALAAASDAFAKDGRIKDAIFSGIKVQGNAVTFTLSATLDRSLVAFSPPAKSAALPQALPAATGGSANVSSTTNKATTASSTHQGQATP